jgi:iron complex outermembrane recepter protein
MHIRVYVARRLVGSLVALGSLSLSGIEPAVAVDSGSTPESDVAELQEVVVTAQKHTSTLERTALSETVLSGSNLTEEKKTNLQEILNQVPGLQMQEDLGGYLINIRGVTNNAGASADNVASIYVDGVYSSQLPVENRAAFFDTSRVEVLRGPQGTLWGGNSLGGAISIITNDPELDHYSVKATAAAGNYDDLAGQAVVNVPIGSDVAVRAVIASENRRGYYSNGQDDSVYNAGRLKLLYQPSDDLRLVLTAMQTKVGGEGPGAVISPYPASLQSLTNPWAAVQPVLFAGNVITPNSPEKADSYRANLDWNVGFGTLTLLPAYTTIDQTTISSPGLVAHIQHTRETGELRLSSLANSPIQWTFGGYFQHFNTPLHVNVVVADVQTGQEFLRETQYAGFGQMTVPITSAFRLTGGVRYTHETRSELDFFIPPAAPITLTFPGSESSGTVTWKAGLEADVAPDTLLYGNVSTGFRAGGLVAGANSPPAAVPPGTAIPAYDPEKLTAYALGIKSQFLDHRAQVNAETFYYHYQNYQVQGGNPFGQTFESNAQGARAYGAELESRLRASASDSIDASLAYLHATFGRQTGGPGSTEDPTSNFYIADGAAMDHSPDWTAHLGYAHSWSVPVGGAFTLAGDANYVTRQKVYFGSHCHPDGTECWQSGHHVMNAHATFDSADDRWNVTAYIRNIENYAAVNGVLTATQSSVGQEVYYLDPPRTFGVSFTLYLEANR